MKYTVNYISTDNNNTITASGTYDGNLAPGSAVYTVASVYLSSIKLNAANGQWIASFKGTTDCTGTVVLVP